MRLLFVKNSLVWPRSSGHDVHTFYMMKACAALGHEISLATATRPEPMAIDGLPLRKWISLDTSGAVGETVPPTTWLQTRFRSFWGVTDLQVSALRHAVAEIMPDAVVIAGLDALPYFPTLSGVIRVWYAADEWVLHHLSQLSLRGGNLRGDLHSAAVKGLYERAHGRAMDHVWVVTESDRRAMRWVSGTSHVDVLPNGVDGEFFRPGNEAVQDRTAVFWGRLDFGPNVQALEWFFRRVWPLVRRAAPDARFTIVGFNPGSEVEKLDGRSGVTLVPNLQDLRSTVRSHALAVLPFVSGGGIKNKLLEAAALGVPIVCTPRATLGLRAVAEAPFAVASRPQDLSDAILKVWNDDRLRREMGAGGRKWVLEHHSWTATARTAIAALQGNGNGASR